MGFPEAIGCGFGAALATLAVACNNPPTSGGSASTSGGTSGSGASTTGGTSGGGTIPDGGLCQGPSGPQCGAGEFCLFFNTGPGLTCVQLDAGGQPGTGYCSPADGGA
ncbi:MAG: hypothetical protein ACYDCL_05355 [Myxococcales bacterium]